MKNRIKELREKSNLSQAELAELAGTTSQQIGRLESGKRQLTQEWLNKLSSALKVSPIAILPSDMANPRDLKIIYKVGYVQAGQWNEACQLPEDEWQEIPYPIEAKLKDKKIFALGVKGESMNMRFPPDKTILICCDIYSMKKEPENGDYVIAYRKKGGLCEATVKKYYKNETTGETILIAESADPRYTNIVIGKDAEYEIGAVVIDFMTKLKDL